MVRNIIGHSLRIRAEYTPVAYRPTGHFALSFPGCDTSPMRKARKPAILIVTVFAVALLVRLAHLWAMRRSPFFDTLLGDTQSYYAWGRQIAGGDIIGHDVFYQAPLYAYFLGAIDTVRASVSAVRVCQAIVGALSCVLLARATAHLFGFTAGIVAGLMLAFYAPAIFFDGLIQKSVLDVFLLSLLLALLTRLMRDAIDSAGADRARWRWLSVGIVLGALSAYWTKLALDYIRSHPMAWMRLEARKFRLLWNRIEIVDTESQESHAEYSPMLQFLGRVWHFGVLAPLACLGLWITWSDRR